MKVCTPKCLCNPNRSLRPDGDFPIPVFTDGKLLNRTFTLGPSAGDLVLLPDAG
jgi:hypothetical protein